MDRLNLWQRLGVVLSFLWAAGAWGHVEWQDREDSKAFADMIFTACMRTEDLRARNGNVPEYGRCFEQRDENLSHKAINYPWWRLPRLILVPVLLGWILVYGTLWTGRWVIAGRRT